MNLSKQQTGKLGESIAATYLINKGYNVINRNWRISRAEVDIIAWDEDMLVFVEVKTRSSKQLGEPAEFVSTRQMEMLFQAAPAFMEELDYEGEIRFDIIGVLIKPGGEYEIDHYEDAWYPGLE